MDSLISLNARWGFPFELRKGRVPSFDQFLDGADVDVAVVKKVLQGRHVLHQKTAVLSDGIAAERGCALFRNIWKGMKGLPFRPEQRYRVRP